MTKTGSEVQINSYTASVQANPVVTGLANGGYVVSWQSVSQDGSDFGVFLKVYDKYGKSSTNEIQVNQYTAGVQAVPEVTSLANGGFVVSWVSDTQPPDSDSWGVFARQFDKTGKALTNEFLVNTTTVAGQYEPSVTGTPDGGYLIAWRSDPGVDIYKQKFDAEGNKVGGELQVNETTAGNQTNPSVASLSNGSSVVTWQSTQLGSSDTFLKVYNKNGDVIKNESIVNDVTVGDQVNPAVSGLSNGNFVVTWTSNQDGDDNIYYRIYDSAGNPISSSKMANQYATGTQNMPSVTSLAGGGFVLSWSSEGQDGNGYAVVGRQFDSNGIPDGDEFIMNTETNNDQSASRASGLTDGGFIGVWHSRWQDGSDWGIFGQRYKATYSVNTQEKAQDYLDKIGKASVSISGTRANLGATQNRLENTICNLQIQAENLQDSESRISDVDVADEMTNYVKQQILVQSAVAMLTQANSLSKLALDIIKQ